MLALLAEQPYTAVGTAAALHSADVTANSGGEIISPNLVVNRTVAAGDVLVQLDARTQSLSLDIGQASHTKAQETPSRFECLQASGTSTVTDVTLSEARVAERLAQAQVGLAQIALDEGIITAIIPGKLGLSEYETGDTLPSGSTAVMI